MRALNLVESRLRTGHRVSLRSCTITALLLMLLVMVAGCAQPPARTEPDLPPYPDRSSTAYEDGEKAVSTGAATPVSAAPGSLLDSDVYADYSSVAPELIADGDPPPTEPVWPHFLPIGGKKVVAMGYELPRPLGVGGNFMYLEQTSTVRDLQLGLAGGDLSDVSFVQIGDVDSRNMSFTGRLDAWVLPFLNVYGVFGYADISTDATVTFVPPPPLLPWKPPRDPIPVDLDVDMDGPVFGGGATLVGGYKNLFGQVDVNYTYTDLDVSDSYIEMLVASGRLGVRGSLGPMKGAVWLGAMYMESRANIHGTLTIAGVPPVDYELRQEPADPWNFLVGGQWELSDRVQFLVEGGFGGRKQVLGGVMIRF